MLLLHTLNLFLVHLNAYFQQLFQYFLHLARSYIGDTGKFAVEINTCSLHQPSVRITNFEFTGKSVGLFVILLDKVTDRESKMSVKVRA